MNLKQNHKFSFVEKEIIVLRYKSNDNQGTAIFLSLSAGTVAEPLTVVAGSLFALGSSYIL